MEPQEIKVKLTAELNDEVLQLVRTLADEVELQGKIISDIEGKIIALKDELHPELAPVPG